MPSFGKKTGAMLVIWLLCQVCNLISGIWMLCAILVGSGRAWTLAKAYDQLGNAATGGNEDELISSRAGRQLQSGQPRRWACILCRLLDYIDHDHCVKSIEKVPE